MKRAISRIVYEIKKRRNAIIAELLFDLFGVAAILVVIIVFCLIASEILILCGVG